MAEMIYGLIAKAMSKIGAIGKDSVNAQQKYKFRGIDAVYNALNPVMSELGLFICPEILEQRREDRENQNHTVLKYSILTIKYTMFAPDGSNVSCTVVGEGMDSGDKASNKAMSVALKYACFQLFMIPTEDLVDPDAESHTVLAKDNNITYTQKEPERKTFTKPAPAPATVAQVAKIPAPSVLDYLANKREELREARGIDKEENNALWNKQVSVLKAAKKVPAKALSAFTQNEAESLVNLMYSAFTPTGTELVTDDGKTA